MMSDGKRTLQLLSTTGMETSGEKIKAVKKAMIELQKVMPPLESMALLGEVDEDNKSHDSLIAEIAAVLTATKRLWEMCVECKALAAKYNNANKKVKGYD